MDEPVRAVALAGMGPDGEDIVISRNNWILATGSVPDGKTPEQLAAEFADYVMRLREKGVLDG